MKLIILHSNYFSPNELGLLSPLYKYRGNLEKIYNIKLQFTSVLTEVEGDAVIISSKWFSRYWGEGGPEQVFNRLKDIRSKTNKIIWFDISDSSGTTHFMVLPYIDLYLKNQVLRNKELYLEKFYGSRIYADFIHRKFGIYDDSEGPPHLNFITSKKNLEKVKVGWNSGMAYYGQYRYIQNYLVSKKSKAIKLFRHKWYSPHYPKKTTLSCRIGTNYSRRTISESRKMIRKLLSHILPGEEKLSHKQYYRELRESRSVLSPFGLGEISLRDFEVTVNGGAIIKQNMSHLDTWPNLWVDGLSYLAFAWDMSDLQSQIEFALSQPRIMTEYAVEAQSIYKNTIDSEKSSQIFCERLNSLIHF